ncbi:MAG: primosomal protein N' [bacterium]
MFIEIVSGLSIDKTFTYAVPKELEKDIAIGKRVLVPFGHRRHLTGYIVNVLTSPICADYEIKDILDVLDSTPVLSDEMLKLTQWIATYYLCSWGEVIESTLPPGININTKTRIKYLKDMPGLDKKAPLQFKILELIKKEKEISLAKLLNILKKRPIYSAINSLIQKELIEIERVKKPALKPKEIKVIKLALPKERILAQTLTQRQRSIIEILHQNGALEPDKLAQKAQTSLTPINNLINKNFLMVCSKQIDREPYKDRYFKPSYPLRLTKEQTESLNAIKEYIKKGEFKVFLLHGITGSGKTEVYLQAIDEVLKIGKGVIVLVPEISLTPQTVERFKARFGGKVAILHSKLSPGERYDQWRRIQEGGAEIVIGARSAIFAPMKNLGLIVIDEEHETTYKQYDSVPRYHARDVAIMRAKFTDAVVILGSATPSVEAYYNTSIGKFYYLHLPSRIDHRPLAEVEIIDMKEELKMGNRSIFSLKLKEAILDRLNKQQQVIIFLNRRGFATFIQCRDCGMTMRCPHCEITLTYHFADKMLKCHYCNFQKIAPAFCPKCQGTQIRYSGTGTQKVEDELQKLFPHSRISRMDLDTTTPKMAHDNILSSFKSGGIDILVGTQMIAKGLDFPNVTLVGVVSADVGLNLPDFRAAERTFGLLTQVAGRAGRGQNPGLVIIQTYNPEHSTIQSAKIQDYATFYSQEITFRKELNYPPFTHLLNIIIKGKNGEETIKLAQTLGSILRSNNQDKTVIILGPAPCPLTKIKEEYRWQILLKGNPKPLRELVKSALDQITIPGYLKINVDVDPIGML